VTCFEIKRTTRYCSDTRILFVKGTSEKQAWFQTEFSFLKLSFGDVCNSGEYGLCCIQNPVPYLITRYLQTLSKNLLRM
jgi:hypothetical protein